MRGVAVVVPLSMLGATLIARLTALAGRSPNGARLCFGIASSDSAGRVSISLVSHPVGLSIKESLVACLGRHPRLKFHVG